MTIWDIALYTGIAALLWTVLIYFVKKQENVFISFIKNWIGTFFIFSGVVKLVDPSGFSIKITEYFDEFGTGFLKPFALQFSIATLVLELVLGVALLFNAQLKWVLKAMVVLILFFTLLTGYSELTGAVQDCGCFGDFLKLTPLTSFIKDVILTGLILLVYFFRKDLKPLFSGKGSAAVVGLSTFAGLAFTLHNLFHLPIWDFRPYKVGNNIPELMVEVEPPTFETTLTYRNVATGEEQTFNQDNYPQTDDWEYVSSDSKEIDPGIPAPVHDFILTTSEGDDITEDLLSLETPVALFIFHDVTKAKDKSAKKIKALTDASDNGAGFNYAFLTSSSDAEMEAFKTANGLEGTNISADNTLLKTMIRSNPGLFLMKEGTVIGKWNYRDIPAPDKLPIH